MTPTVGFDDRACIRRLTLITRVAVIYTYMYITTTRAETSSLHHRGASSLIPRLPKNRVQ